MDTHKPVMAEDLLAFFSPFSGLCCDATFGRGGHSRLFLEKFPESRLIALDRDPEAISAGKVEFAEFAQERFQLLEARFGGMEDVMAGAGLQELDGIIFDLGLCSAQLDKPERGFSFSKEGPLDMRMGGQGRDAAWYVNNLDEAELAKVFFEGGVERFSRRLARAIIRARDEEMIETTSKLAVIIQNALPPRGKKAIDPATVGFQALRIRVNEEFDELEKGLRAAEKLLAAGGILAVISFHSGEDKIVKSFLKSRSETHSGVSRHRPSLPDFLPSFELVLKKPLMASTEECRLNPRARSAKLRVARRTDSPAHYSRPLTRRKSV